MKMVYEKKIGASPSKKQEEYCFPCLFLYFIHYTPTSRVKGTLIPDDTTHVLADIVWPEKKSKQSFPKGEIEKSNSKEPSREPREAGETMILDFYFVHNFYTKV